MAQSSKKIQKSSKSSRKASANDNLNENMDDNFMLSLSGFLEWFHQPVNNFGKKGVK